MRLGAKLSLMTRMIRRQQRKIALALLLLNVSGARAISVSGPCERDHVFFSAGLGFKAVVKTVARREWKKAPPNAWGERTNRYKASDLETVKRVTGVSTVTVHADRAFALDLRSPRAGPASDWKLPTDVSPTHPSHLLI
jgi:hypothetical protein